jgi:uncharacterized membrane protein
VLMTMITFITLLVALYWGLLLMDERISIFLHIGIILIFLGM